MRAERLDDQSGDLARVVGCHNRSNLARCLDPSELLDDVITPRGNIFCSMLLAYVLTIVPGHRQRPPGDQFLLVPEILNLVDDGLR
jgi:hypothetical protein